MGIGSRLFLIIFISLGLGIFVSYIIAERDITDTFQKHIINELQNQASLLAEVVDEVDSIGDLNEADSLADNLTLANFCLNKLNPATYFSAFILFAFGKLIIN